MFYFEAQPANADILGYGAAAGASNRRGVNLNAIFNRRNFTKLGIKLSSIILFCKMLCWSQNTE